MVIKMVRSLRNIIKAVITFVAFSLKQKKILTWWCPGSPYKDYNGIIADGSIRAGKTVSMALSFVFWAMDTFDGQNFAMCGKTVGSFRRNVWAWLKPTLIIRGYRVEEVKTENLITISRKGKINYFYVFGGRDESSQDLIQGLTLAGVFFDEVALMPESFVNQATGRCSVDGAKMWFNCNPESPMHYVKTDWIDQAKAKKILHLHFTMDDNPSLSEATKERYKLNYKGVFYQRFILGLWVIAQGAIYDMWEDSMIFDDEDLKPYFKSECRRYIAIDYGTTNPMVFLDIYDDGEVVWILNEYYYDCKKQDPNTKEHRRQKTDQQYADDLKVFIGDEYPDFVIIDPSAASFKIVLRNMGFRIKEADNSVNDGIRVTAMLMSLRRLRIHRNCQNTLLEIQAYIWDDKAAQRGEEKPVKQNDHAMDALRYFCKTIISKWRLSA